MEVLRYLLRNFLHRPSKRMFNLIVKFCVIYGYLSVKCLLLTGYFPGEIFPPPDPPNMSDISEAI